MEKTLLRRYIFAVSNGKNMLHAISWKEFFTLMGLAALIYYGWLVVKYLPLGFLRGLTGKQEGTGLPFSEWRKEKEAPGAVSGTDMIPVVGGGSAVGSAAGYGAAAGGETQPGEARPLALPLPAQQIVVPFTKMRGMMENDRQAAEDESAPAGKEKGVGELAEELGRELNAIYERAVQEQIPREELLLMVSRLLGKEVYLPLRGSHLQGPVSESIFSGLMRCRSIRLDAAEMRTLWDG